jgi:hypothetical protein
MSRFVRVTALAHPPSYPSKSNRANASGANSGANAVMDSADLFKAFGGATLGFILGQLVNVAKLVREWWVRPRFEIHGYGDDWHLLSHGVQAGNGEFYDEIIYGFEVTNKGRSTATGVRVQLIQIEVHEKGEEYRVISRHASDLRLYSERRTETTGNIVLIRGASIVVQLASWREDYHADYHAIFPAVAGLPDYYEESCQTAFDYRFSVAVFDDKGSSAHKVITIS